MRVDTTSRVAYGPAIGVTGTALTGPTLSFVLPEGRFLAHVTAKVRTLALSVPVENGSVLVEMSLAPGQTEVSAVAKVTSDHLDDTPSLWSGMRYTRTGSPAAWAPNVPLPPEGATLRVRVWNRDNYDANRQIAVDVAVTISSEPIPGISQGFGPREGPGTVRTVTGANPAAGAECSDAVPTGVSWRLEAWTGVLVTDATAISRNVQLKAGAVVGACDASQTASLTGTYSTGLYGPTPFAGFFHTIGMMPGLLLNAGDVIATTTLNIQAGDNYGSPALRVEEWVVPGLAAA